MTLTQEWNGTSWSEQSDLATGRGQAASWGAVDGAIYAGGTPPTSIVATEKFDGTSWSELADLPTAKRATAYSGGPAGNTNDGVLWMGSGGSANDCFEYTITRPVKTITD